MAGATDPSGRRNSALDAFLETKEREGYRIETHTDAHAIVIDAGNRKPPSRYEANSRGGACEDIALDEGEIERALRAIEGLPMPA